MNQIKKFLVVVLCSVSLLLVSFTSSQADDKIIKQTQSHNIFKGALLSIWAKFQSFNPHKNQNATAQTVYTAGIRGAESTGTLIQPVWKDDVTQDKKFQKELQMFGKAMTQLDNGDLQKAVNSLDDFLQQYGKSSLRPNALFAKGMSYAGMNNKQKSKQSLQQFIDAYPNHPLASDAKQVIQQLQ